MKRYSIALTVLALMNVNGRAITPSEGDGNPPNVIIFLADDQGYNDASVNQHITPTYTPNLERLAASGVTFTDGYASAPMCTPSRVGLHSGRSPARFGIYDVGGDAMITWPQETKIISQYLKEAGYATGVVGKWHCGGDLEPWRYNYPLNRGFDYFWGFMGSTHDYFDPNIGSGVNGAGYSSCGYQPIRENGEIVESITYLTSDITEKSVDFIRKNKDKPFYLYVAHHTPHVPLQVPEEYYQAYGSLGLGNASQITRGMQEISDESLGAILDELDQLGLRNNTLILYTSDNGGSERSGQLNGHLRGGKFYLMEGGIRVPMVISWPGNVPEGKIYRYPVTNLDFLPTVLAAASLKPDGPVDGVDLLPYIEGEKKDMPHDMLFWRQPENMASYAIRAGKWKLVYSKLGRGLFNLEEDPGETTDLRDEYPEIVEQLDAAYQTWDKSNADSKWTKELQKEYFAQKESAEPLENLDYKYNDTFGGEK